MNLGIFSSIIDQGVLTGVGYYTLNLIKNLSDIAKPNNLNIYLITDNKNKRFISNNIFINNPFKIAKTYSWYPFAALNIRKMDLDVIHNPTQFPTIFKFKQSYVATIHDLIPLAFPQESSKRKYAMRLLYPKTIRTMDKIITVSNSTKKDLIKYFSISQEKIIVIYSGVDPKFHKIDYDVILNSKNTYKFKEPFILFVGTSEPRKNIDGLIKAFYKLKKKGLSHKLVLSGKTGWRDGNVFKLVSDLRLNGEIIFTGYIPESELVKLYNLADLFIFPSFYEGFGLPLIEAMACGCPLISSNQSSMPEIVGDAGILFNPNDIDALSSIIYDTLNDEGLRCDMSKRGLDRAKLFNWKNCAKKTLDVYNKL